ncbi:MAG TPA: type II toxin-antitoxin system RelE/ParE family toxin [Bacillota bacterium]|jgi:mRNA-degrading endonuclease RelE of RelBE toxin-antitoxin system|nr:type II toxin-antitoxin system RelE/ParE family toxin [Bacillota bacterium]
MTSRENLTFKVRLSRRAEGYLRRTDRNTQKRIAAAIENIRQNPIRGLHIRPLEGRESEYRYYLGNLRIVYTVHPEERLIDITSIGPRGDIYK